MSFASIVRPIRTMLFAIALIVPARNARAFGQTFEGDQIQAAFVFAQTILSNPFRLKNRLERSDSTVQQLLDNLSNQRYIECAIPFDFVNKFSVKYRATQNDALPFALREQRPDIARAPPNRFFCSE